MKQEFIIQNITEMIRPIVEEQNLELYYVEYVKEDNENYLRIYIDRPEGISLDDCEKVSRPVSDLLDVKDPIPESYYLEVSSPGINRILYTDAHLDRYKGSEVLVKVKAPIDGKRALKGTLAGHTDSDITLNIDGNLTDVPRSKISTISLEGEL